MLLVRPGIWGRAMKQQMWLTIGIGVDLESRFTFNQPDIETQLKNILGQHAMDIVNDGCQGTGDHELLDTSIEWDETY